MSQDPDFQRVLDSLPKADPANAISVYDLLATSPSIGQYMTAADREAAYRRLTAAGVAFTPINRPPTSGLRIQQQKVRAYWRKVVSHA